MLNRLTRPQSPAKGPMFSYQYDQDQLQSTTITVSESRRAWQKSRCRKLLIHGKRNWERDKEVSSVLDFSSMNYTGSHLNIMFDLVLTAPSRGVASHYSRIHMNEPGGGSQQWPKTHTYEHMKETHIWAHTHTYWGTACDHAFINNGSG